MLGRRRGRGEGGNNILKKKEKELKRKIG